MTYRSKVQVTLYLHHKTALFPSEIRDRALRPIRRALKTEPTLWLDEAVVIEQRPVPGEVER